MEFCVSSHFTLTRHPVKLRRSQENRLCLVLPGDISPCAPSEGMLFFLLTHVWPHVTICWQNILSLCLYSCQSLLHGPSVIFLIIPKELKLMRALLLYLWKMPALAFYSVDQSYTYDLPLGHLNSLWSSPWLELFWGSNEGMVLVCCPSGRKSNF